MLRYLFFNYVWLDSSVDKQFAFAEASCVIVTPLIVASCAWASSCVIAFVNGQGWSIVDHNKSVIVGFVVTNVMAKVGIVA